MKITSYQKHVRHFEEEVEYSPITGTDSWTDEDWEDYSEWLYASYNRPVDYGFDSTEG